MPLPAADLATIFCALGTGFLLEKLIDPDGVPDALFGDALVLVLQGLSAHRDSTSAPAPVP